MKIEDIANLAGVSTATISRVLNHPEKVNAATRDKVQRIFDQTNFVANAVARGLAISSMRTIGILANEITSLWIAKVVYTIERRFTELGYNTILINTGVEPENKKRCLRMILERQVDGVILVGSMFKEKNNDHIVQAARKVPVLLINNHIQANNIFSVVSDDAQGVRNAVLYLTDLGHRHIYYFRDSKYPSALAKLNGFQQEMREQGLNPANFLDIGCGMPDAGAGLRSLIEQGKKVTAVICGEDLTAVGAAKAGAQLRLEVPRDLSVIGYNNSLLAEAATPALTSIDNHSAAVALAAAERLNSVLQGQSIPKKMLFTPGLIIRESTGPAPAQ